MPASSDIRTPSKGGFIAFVILSVAALLTDFASLVLVTTWLRATEAAYPVYGVGAALTLAAAVILIVRRKDIVATAKDAVLSAKFFASLKRYSIFERAFTDYGWRTLLSALAVLAGNVVYVSYLIWMAVAYISPWYAALAGFYAWLASCARAWCWRKGSPQSGRVCPPLRPRTGTSSVSSTGHCSS